MIQDINVILSQIASSDVEAKYLGPILMMENDKPMVSLTQLKVQQPVFYITEWLSTATLKFHNGMVSSIQFVPTYCV